MDWKLQTEIAITFNANVFEDTTRNDYFIQFFQAISHNDWKKFSNLCY